jgi:hypothetical protein
MNHGLELFVGVSTKIFPSNELNEQGQIRNFFERGEFYATVEPADNCTSTSCEGTGIFRMVANSRTLPLMEYFWCRATHNSLRDHEDSNLAFAEVLYPESLCAILHRICTSATTYKPVNATKIPYYAYSDNMTVTPTTNNGSQILTLNLSGFILLFIFFSVCLLNIHG